MKKKWFIMCLTATMLVGTLSGCGRREEEIKLDPSNPVSLTVWHYYNGARQATFDALLDEFNDTVGREQGIYVEGNSLGSVSDLEAAITDSLEGKVGAKQLPDLFSSYADTAYSVQKQGKLTDLTNYFTQEELDEYVPGYIEEGYLNGDEALYLFPTAKSTEIMMLNKTAWEPFEAATGVKLSDLATTEGITKVAKEYYEWTDAKTPDVEGDGKAFYGRDSMSNYFVIGMRQMGKEIFEVQNGEVSINTDKELLKRLWENYYVPYVNGYFAAFGKFRSDDVKTGDIVAYTGSTSSVMYFPDMVVAEEGDTPIDYMILAAPTMEGGENYKVQQGAGMAVTKSDSMHEYAACVFLKWFTQKDNNLKFVCDSGYMPVKKDANSVDALQQTVASLNLEISPKVVDCLKCVMNEADKVKYYTTKSFENGYAVRKILDYNLSDLAAADKQQIDEAVANGADRQEEIAKYTSEESFENWYEAFCQLLEQKAQGK